MMEGGDSLQYHRANKFVVKKVPDKFDDQGAPTLDLGDAKEVE